MTKSSIKKWVLKDKKVQHWLSDITRLDPYPFAERLNRACEEALQKQAEPDTLITVKYGKEYSVNVFSHIYQCHLEDCKLVNPDIYKLKVGFISDFKEYENEILYKYYSEVLSREGIDIWDPKEAFLTEEIWRDKFGDFTYDEFNAALVTNTLVYCDILIIPVSVFSPLFATLLSNLHERNCDKNPPLQKVVFVGSKGALQDLPRVQKMISDLTDGVGVCTPKDFLNTFYKVSEELVKAKWAIL